jgi:hypothetical protein
MAWYDEQMIHNTTTDPNGNQSTTSTDELISPFAQVKELAKRYFALTGRPLSVTSEIAEYEASRLLGLELAPVRQPGWDATGRARAVNAFMTSLVRFAEDTLLVYSRNETINRSTIT